MTVSQGSTDISGRLWMVAGFIVLAASLWAAPLIAQPRSFFGSGDAPDEQIHEARWNRAQELDMRGGFSLIGAQWRTAGNLSSHIDAGPIFARIEGTLRTGIYGRYRPDTDEAYDLVRMLSFARLNTGPRSRLYVRAGPIRRMRLGTGHLVDFFSSETAWDERTVGAEAMWQDRTWEVGAFTDDVRFDGIVGGRIAVNPLDRLRSERLRSLRIGVNLISDQAANPDSTIQLRALNLEAGFDAVRSGAFILSPFVSWGRYRQSGTGLFVGMDAHSDNFIDIARLQFRIGIQFNGHQFIPGYIGSFYQVQSTHARVANSDVSNTEQPSVAGIDIRKATGGNTFVSELRVLIFNSFEFWVAFNRAYGSQKLSTFHLRLFLRTRRFRLSLGQDRGGLGDLFSLFSSVNNFSSLDFQTDYRVVGPFWIFVRARYTYERISRIQPRVDRFLVQRRFEPFSGFRFTF